MPVARYCNTTYCALYSVWAMLYGVVSCAVKQLLGINAYAYTTLSQWCNPCSMAQVVLKHSEAGTWLPN